MKYVQPKCHILASFFNSIFYGKIDNVPYKNTNQAFSNFYLKPCLVNQYYLLTLTQKQH